MKDRIRKLGKILRHLGARSLIIALVVLLLTAALAIYVGNSLSRLEKEVLQQRGELNAMEAAMEYDRCLLTRVNIVTLVGRTVDKMLASGTNNEKIEAYLKEQSECIKQTLDPGSTGLYGWIDGEYLDGVGWVPDEGYVATERPWYTETLVSDREITFVDPYLDMQTKTIMMTVSELLEDEKSVLAMDVSLDPIQQIVEQVVSGTEGSQAFVLDEGGIIVAHSEENELGKNYLAEPDTLGGAVAKKILSDGQMQFEIRRTEGNFSVYVHKLEGGWFSVSMINADVWYRPLRRAMIIFCVVLVLVAAFLAFVFLRIIGKNLALQRLHTRIRQEEKRGKELQELSETDRMTGLLDRVSGERRVNELLESGDSGMFIEVDIDDFKAVNDTCGHQAGDLVIRAVADSLRSAFRSNDIIMRLGGDEFCVYAVGIVDPEMGKAIVRRLFMRLGKYRLEEYPDLRISVSAGAVIHTGTQETSFAGLYACADSAMYDSKNATGNSLTFGTLPEE